MGRAFFQAVHIAFKGGAFVHVAELHREIQMAADIDIRRGKLLSTDIGPWRECRFQDIQGSIESAESQAAAILLLHRPLHSLDCNSHLERTRGEEQPAEIITELRTARGGH